MESRNFSESDHVSAQTNSKSPGPVTDGEASSRGIPSHVFARNKSNDPGQWSFASNESLFSIHNTSFAKEDWTSKSGELGYFGDSIIINSPLIEIPTSSQVPARKSTSKFIHEEDEDEDEDEDEEEEDEEEEDESDTEAAAAETMRENECKQHNNIAKDSSLTRTMSHRSDTSVQSFAFPILTGNSGKCGSLKPNPNATSKRQKPKAYTPPRTTPPTSPVTPVAKTPSESPNNESPKPGTETQRHGCAMKWLYGCFSCCPSICRHKPG